MKLGRSALHAVENPGILNIAAAAPSQQALQDHWQYIPEKSDSVLPFLAEFTQEPSKVVEEILYPQTVPDKPELPTLLLAPEEEEASLLLKEIDTQEPTLVVNSEPEDSEPSPYTYQKNIVIKRQPRLGRNAYHAIETHGCFGIVDSGFTDAHGYQVLVIHVPRTSRGYVLDFAPGEIIHINSCIFPNLHGVIEVGYVTPYKYIRPGNSINTCCIGVPKHQWEMFVDYSQ